MNLFDLDLIWFSHIKFFKIKIKIRTNPQMILIDLDLIFSHFDEPVSNYIIGSLTIIRHFYTPSFNGTFLYFN